MGWGGGGGEEAETAAGHYEASVTGGPPKHRSVARQIHLLAVMRPRSVSWTHQPPLQTGFGSLKRTARSNRRERGPLGLWAREGRGGGGGAADLEEGTGVKVREVWGWKTFCAADGHDFLSCFCFW